MGSQHNLYITCTLFNCKRIFVHKLEKIYIGHGIQHVVSEVFDMCGRILESERLLLEDDEYNN